MRTSQTGPHGSMEPWKRVVVVQRILPHYRVRFFRDLHDALADYRIQFVLLYGQEAPGGIPKSVDLDADWAIRLRNKYLSVLCLRAVWQPILPWATATDLIVVEQSNQLLVNYVLLFMRMLGRIKFAYWGHGKNFQGTSHPLSEKFKSYLLKSADWWFAYTSVSAEHVASQGFPEDRITDVQNSIDTSGLRAEMDACGAGAGAELLRSLGLCGENVLLYCGGLYEQKQLPFLINACRRVWLRKPDIELVIIGDGPARAFVEAAAAENAWIRYVGPKYGKELAPYLTVAKAMLIPGVVGLAIVDSFAACVPLFTTDIPGHGPEIAYLEEQKTGFVTSFDEDAYSKAVIEFLENPMQQATVREQLKRASTTITHEAMVGRFARGVARAVGASD